MRLPCYPTVDRNKRNGRCVGGCAWIWYEERECTWEIRREQLHGCAETLARMPWPLINKLRTFRLRMCVGSTSSFRAPLPSWFAPLGVQYWIRLAAVSYRGKKVRTVVSLVVRSVNKSRDAQNCAQNEPKYAICIFTTRLYFKALGLLLCDLICQIRHTLQGLWRWPLWRYRSPQDVSAGHGRCHGDNPWKFRNDVIV